MQIRTVSVIGGGAWGTALAQTLAHGGNAVTLWAREPEIVDDINARNVNRVFLPGISLHPTIRATDDLVKASNSDAILAVVPAQHMRGVMGRLARNLKADVPVVVCSKGIEQGTGKFLGDVIRGIDPTRATCGADGPKLRSRRGARFADGVDSRPAIMKRLAGLFQWHSRRARCAYTGQAT